MNLINKKKYINFNKPQEMKLTSFKLIKKKFGPFYYYPPIGYSSNFWYKKFNKLLNKKIKEKKYFPIFRMSDGEFTFLLGRYFYQYKFIDKIIYFLLHVKRSLYYKSTFYSSGRKGYCETYSLFDLKKLRINFLENLKQISKKGFICPNFSTHILTKPYQKDILDLLSKNNIILNRSNYFGYYFVTDFFLGKNIKKIFKNKKILIFTSNMKKRNKNLKKNLEFFGAKEIQFYFTSLNAPMYDKIDLKKIKINPDFVLVAAGVGSSNILVQLKNLKCLCVDCGFVVDALSDIDMARRRVYHLNDEFMFKKKWNSN